MVSALYVVSGAIFLIILSLHVVKLRAQYQVAQGDGGFYELQTAIRMHGNAVEYLPVALILLVVMEMNGSPNWTLHLCGILLLAGRVLHALGLHRHEHSWRQTGMSLTYVALIIMVLLNLWYLPWDLVLTWR